MLGCSISGNKGGSSRGTLFHFREQGGSSYGRLSHFRRQGGNGCPLCGRLFHFRKQGGSYVVSCSISGNEGAVAISFPYI